MLKKKYPELEKPVKYARKMSLLDRWRDVRFHRNLAKIDEECLREQWRIDGLTEEEIEERMKLRDLEYREKQEFYKWYEREDAKGNLDAIMDIHEKGREDGFAEGSEKSKLTIARNALAKGSTPEFIQKITGLSLEEIQKLSVEEQEQN